LAPILLGNLVAITYWQFSAQSPTRQMLVLAALWALGARTLLAYSSAKADHVATLLAAAKAWKGGAR
jgi:hypothetical protein